MRTVVITYSIRPVLKMQLESPAFNIMLCCNYVPNIYARWLSGLKNPKEIGNLSVWYNRHGEDNS